MMRVKLPGGMVNAEQLRVIADLTDEYARGFCDVTTAQAIQWHWLTVENFPRRYRATGCGRRDHDGRVR
jgi:ferredoxin-nitrite reductase